MDITNNLQEQYPYKVLFKGFLVQCCFVGFRPFPSRIEASEFEQLQAQAEKDNDPDVNLLSEWLVCNCVCLAFYS